MYFANNIHIRIRSSENYLLYSEIDLHKKRMTTSKIILTPINKEQKICHALATTSAFNLKLYHILRI